MNPPGLTGAIGADDGGEAAEGPDDLAALIGLEVLDLDELQEAHGGPGKVLRGVPGRFWGVPGRRAGKRRLRRPLRDGTLRLPIGSGRCQSSP